MKGIDLVFSCFGHYTMVPFAEIVIHAMQLNGIRRIYWMATLCIYGEVDYYDEHTVSKLGDHRDPNTYLGDQRQAADLIKNNHLTYTNLRPNWLINKEALEEILIDTRHQQSLVGEIIRMTVGNFIDDLVNDPHNYLHASIALIAVKADKKSMNCF